MKRRIDMIDLSNYQADLKIDWSEARKAGVRVMVHKATEGTDWTDSSYAARRTEAAANGVIFGSYHFAHPAPGNAIAEADAYLRFAKPDRNARDLAPILDLEVNEKGMDPDALTAWVEEWFHHVFRALGVKRGFLYTHFTLTKRPKGVTLWTSRYSNSNSLPVVPRPFRTWAMWQFTNGEYGDPSAVPGVGRVDASTFHKRFRWVRLANLRMPAYPPTTKTRKRKPHHKPTPIDQIVALAKSQVGYHEGRSNGHWDNVQKFSRQVPALRWSQGQPWCCTFVSWLALKSNLSGYYPQTASCKEAMAWWQAKNQWSEYPAIGAQVIFGNGEHTGLVYWWDNTYVYTVEGNTNTNGSAEGDGVYLKKRLRRDPYVTGYGYPEIPGLRLKTADPNYYPSRSAA